MVRRRVEEELHRDILELRTLLYELELKYDRLLKSQVALNKKINAVSKNEVKEENDKINEWLTDDRVEDIQSFLHKGVK